MTDPVAPPHRAIDLALAVLVIGGLGGVLFTAAPWIPPAAPDPAHIERLPNRHDAALRLRPGPATLSLDTIAVVDSGPVVVAGHASPVVTVTPGYGVSLGGWAVDGDVGKGASAVLATVDGKVVERALAYGPRPDVASALRMPDAVHCQFAISIPGSALPPGTHHIGLRAVSADGSTYRNATLDVTVQVRSGPGTVRP
ncbi:MAG TPA: hypothetical protein VGN14_10280 [Candidatus Elarobacter sp.]|jgi:hypothetical protein